MNKRGIALIFSLLVIMVLSILLSSFFIKSINENNLVKRYVGSLEALWAAEAGVADTIQQSLPASVPYTPINCNLGNCHYSTTTNYRTNINGSDYYDIDSTGIVSFPGAGDIRRTVSAIVKKGPVNSAKFKYGIGAANDLCFGGGCHGTPNDYLDPDICNGVACWKEFDATINFRDLFGYSQSDVSAIATHYTDANFMTLTSGAVSGVTWVDVAPGNTLDVGGSETGSGVLIIDGNAKFAGSYQFHGIVYILGTFTARGTMDAYGSIIVASSAGVDTINGTPEFHYNQPDIETVLQQLSNDFVDIVSWKEG